MFDRSAISAVRIASRAQTSASTSRATASPLPTSLRSRCKVHTRLEISDRSLSAPATGQRRRLVFGLSDLTKYWELDFLASVAKSEDQQNFQNPFSQAQMRLILSVWKWESTKLPESRYHRKSSGWLVSHVWVNDFVCSSCACESKKWLATTSSDTEETSEMENLYDKKAAE